jgi:hypothetical protein
VYLHQVDRRLADALEGGLDLFARSLWVCGSPAARRDVELGRPEQLVRDAQLLRHAPGHLL